ncbi:MAG TPA: hypothetical protein VF828_05040 [Patescibacteria group bacterium]
MLAILFALFLSLLNPVSVLAQSDTISPSPTVGETTPVSPVPTPPMTITIGLLPSQVEKGVIFSTSVSIANGKPNTAYYLKIFGTINGDNYGIQVQSASNWPNGYNIDWTQAPGGTTDSSGNLTKAITLRSNTDKSSGTYILTPKIKEAATDTGDSGTSKTLTVVDPAPTNTPTPIPSNTNTPTITPTRTITPTPSRKLTPSPTPTTADEPTPTYVDEPTPIGGFFTTPTSVPDSTVLGDSASVTPAPAAIKTSSHRRNLLPFVLVITGGLFILIPLIIGKINKTPKHVKTP